MTIDDSTRQRPSLVDSDAIYVTGEDCLRITSFNSLAGVVLALEGRFLRMDGIVVPFVERHVPNSNYTAATSLVTLGEGFLGNVQVRATSGAPQQGQCYIIVEIVRGRLAALQPLATLLQGYASDVQRLAWPGSPFVSSVAGAGVLRSITGTNPAAGLECSDTVPAGARWRLNSWFAQLTTDATVVNRTVALIIDDGANILFRVDASAAQTATQVRQYEAYATGVAPDVSGTAFRLPAPFPLSLAAGSRIRTLTAGIVAGDDWTAPQMLVEEQIAG
jgi:hypothetical protein